MDPQEQPPLYLAVPLFLRPLLSWVKLQVDTISFFYVKQLNKPSLALLSFACPEIEPLVAVADAVKM